MSHKTRVVFTVHETEAGQPYLTMEFHDDVPGLPDDPPIFDLVEGSTMEEAEVLAKLLNMKIASYRPFPQPPKFA